MPINMNVNCTSYKSPGICLHQAAPRRWLGAADRIVFADANSPQADPRRELGKCLLCTPHPRPAPPPRDP